MSNSNQTSQQWTVTAEIFEFLFLLLFSSKQFKKAHTQPLIFLSGLPGFDQKHSFETKNPTNFSSKNYYFHAF